MNGTEYSVGKTYKMTAAILLLLSPYGYYRFFADLIYGSDGRHWATIHAAFLSRPLVMSLFLGLPVAAVFIGLAVLTYRFAVDLLFPRRINGVLESARIVKTKWFGDRIKVDIGGRTYRVLHDLGAAQFLLDEAALGKPVEMRVGGLSKVLYLRRD